MIIFLICVSVFYACTQDNNIFSKKKDRWYTEAQVDQGKTVFETNCIACHGMNAQGTPDWKTPLPDASYPPPPLNGTAHAWHHSLSSLKRTIVEGGARFGGKMPGFQGNLPEGEILSVMSYFQHFWTDEIYEHWLDRGGLD